MSNVDNYNLNNQKILVTGGTGSFGNAFVSATLKKLLENGLWGKSAG